MLKGQPKGLFVLALANMGERFGYYTMLAIFVLYMQAKFGYTSDATSTTFGVFLSMVYFLPLFGGLLADKVLGYGKTIMLGIVVMFAGYFCLAIPSGVSTGAQVAMFGALALIAIGTGCFKGNLQALVGNLYDDPKYSAKRDIAFSIFYMCINIGAFFAPSAAEGVSNYFMGKDGYTYNANVPSLYHQLDRAEIKTDGYLNLGRIAHEQGTLVIAPAEFDKYNTAQADSTSPTVATLFGNILAPEAVAKAEADLDSVILARYGQVTNASAINVSSLRTAILAGLTPVSDTAQLSGMIKEADLQALAAIGTKSKKDIEGAGMAAFNPKRDTTALQKVEKTLAAAVNTQICKSLDREQLLSFGEKFTVSLSKSYNYGFGVACLSLIFSMLIFIGFRKYYKAADKTEKQKQAEHNPNVVQLTPQQVKDRLVALGLVFAVVIFFWMSFHQNGLTMTFFARDYTQTVVSGGERFGFSLLTLVPFIVAFYGLLSLFQSKNGKGRFGGFVVMAVGAVCAWWAYTSLPQPMSITPQIFQQFNPFFIIILTPLTVGLFSWLQKRNSEPSAPRKIGIGMIIAALGFVLLAFASTGLPTPNAVSDMGGLAETGRVSANWLISTYFVLTIAELFLSPMGISFVSKVAPPKYKGLAQGGWLAATAVGNYLVAIIGYMWGGMSLWMLWGILVVCCAVSAIFLFSVMKKLERTTKDA